MCANARTASDLERTRRLAWEGCLNARDLGGFPTDDGRERRWGAVVRSDHPGRLTAAGRDALIVYGIRTIVDLRLPHEIGEYPNPFAEPGSHGVLYAHRSFIEPGVPLPPNLASMTLVENYSAVLGRFSTSVGAIMASIATAPEGGVLVHCAVGKDRTGMISAMLLELLGVDRETIAADYALTAQCLEPETSEWLRNGPGERSGREQFLAQHHPRAEVILEVIERLDDRYGGVETYLLEAGVTPAEISMLRDRLL